MLTGAEGGCLCGALRYRVTGAAQRVTVCHCRFCQRATGAPYLVEAMMTVDDLQVTAGSPAVYDHRSAGSGQIVHVHFCATCGTKLYLSFDRWPTAIGLYVGTLDDPTALRIDGPADKHIFLDMAHPDTVIPAGITTYREHAATPDGAGCAATTFDTPVRVADLPDR